MAELRKIASERFPNLAPRDVNAVISVAQRAALAGRMAVTGPHDEIPPLEDIPINPDLFGDDPQGRRFQGVVEVNVADPDSDAEYNVRLTIDFATLPDFDELFDRVIEFINQLIDNYPGRFGQMTDFEAEELALDIIGLQRRF